MSTPEQQQQQQQHSASASPGGTTNAGKPPRLTEEEKKGNHIASENKRRCAIRQGFDKLSDMVPGLEGCGRSEGHVLNVSVQFLMDKLAERRDLVEQIEARGGAVPAELKEVLRIDLDKVNTEYLQNNAPRRGSTRRRSSFSGDEMSGSNNNNNSSSSNNNNNKKNET